MCWQTRYKTKLKVAEDNIPVTKIVRVSSDIIQAYYVPGFIYSKKIFHSKLDLPYLYGRSWRVQKGFHSYKSSCPIELCKMFYPEGWKCSLIVKNFIGICLDVYNPFFSSDLGIMSCIIPKGSKYYENEHGEIVSDTIKPIYCYKIK